MKINKLLSSRLLLSSIYMLSMIFISNIFVSDIYSWVKFRNNMGVEAIVWINVVKGGDNHIVMRIPAGESVETNDDQALGSPMIKKEVKIYYPSLRVVKKNFYNKDKSINKKYEFIEDKDGWGYLLQKGKDPSYVQNWAHTGHYGIECRRRDLRDDGGCKKTRNLTEDKGDLTTISCREDIWVTRPNLDASCGLFSCGGLNVTYILGAKFNPPGSGKPQFDYTFDHTTSANWNHEKKVLNLNDKKNKKNRKNTCKKIDY